MAQTEVAHGEEAAGNWSRAAVRVLILLTAATPLVYLPVYYPFVVPRTVVFRLLVAVAAAVTAYLVLSSETSRVSGSVHRDPVLWALGAVVATGAVAAVSGSSPYHSLLGEMERMWGVAGWLSLALFYWTARTVLDAVWWRRLLVAHVAVAVVVGVHRLGLAAFPEAVPAAPSAERALASMVGNPGFLGAYMLVGLGATGLLLLEAEKRWTWRLLVSAAVVLAGALFLTGSRAAVIGLALGLLTALVAWTAVTGRGRARIAAGGAAVGVVMVGALLLSNETGRQLVAQVPAVDEIVEGEIGPSALGPRLLAWEAGLESLASNPWLGVGPENFEVAFDRHFDPSWHDRVGTTPFDRAHNAYLGAFVENGIVGGLAYLAVWGALLWSFARGWRRGRLSDRELALLFATTIGYGGYLFFWFEDISSSLLFLTVAGWGIARSRAPAPDDSRTEELPQASESGHWIRMAAAGLLVALVAGAAYGQVSYLRAAHETALARGTSDLRAKDEHYARAAELDPPGEEEVPSAYATMVGTELTETLGRIPRSQWPVSFLEGAARKSREAIRRAVDENPLKPRLRTRYASVLLTSYLVTENRSHLERAVEEAERAVEQAPNRIAFYHSLADLYLVAEAPEAALDVTQEAYRRYGRLPGTYRRLARSYHALDRPKPAYSAVYEGLRRGLELGDLDLVRQVLEATPEEGRPARRDSLCAYLSGETDGLCGNE